MDFYYEFGPGPGHHFNYTLPEHVFDLGGGIAVAAAVIFVVVMLTVLAVSVAVYVLQALAVHSMAKRRGIENAWLAWVPVASGWILGSVADDINARRGKKTVYGPVLLVLTAVGAAGSFSMFLQPLLWLAAAPLSLAVMVVNYIVLYEIFNDYAPKNAALYLVLSILLGIQWILLFLLREKRPLSLGGGFETAAAEEALQPEQPPVGWSPVRPHPFDEPRPCPKEHWGGIMQAEEFWPEPHIDEDPDLRGNKEHE